MKADVVRRLIAIPVIALAVQVVSPAAQASHSWGGYHWARTTTEPFTLKLVDSVSSTWDSYLETTRADWSASSVVDLATAAGNTRHAKRCPATSGQVQVCNSTYGRNGWLGIAEISISGDHILQGTVKLNDTYFSSAPYNTPAWRNLVMRQEVGHTLGLDHQDETYGEHNLGTCMDYTNNPESNQHPNGPDYDQLGTIHNHADATSTVSPSAKSGSLGSRPVMPPCTGRATPALKSPWPSASSACGSDRRSPSSTTRSACSARMARRRIAGQTGTTYLGITTGTTFTDNTRVRGVVYDYLVQNYDGASSRSVGLKAPEAV